MVLITVWEAVVGSTVVQEGWRLMEVEKKRMVEEMTEEVVGIE